MPMAATTTIKPLLPLSLSPNKSCSYSIPSSSSFISCNPISDSTVTFSLLHSNRPRGQISVSVAFNPQGNFDISMFEDEGSKLYIFHFFSRYQIPFNSPLNISSSREIIFIRYSIKFQPRFSFLVLSTGNNL